MKFCHLIFVFLIFNKNSLMLKYSKIKSPTFAINTVVARVNIENMIKKIPKSCTFRPHFKTHNNKKTAELFRALGNNKITVSSIDMALYFRQIGFKDITIAFPTNTREQKKINKLCANTTVGLTFSNFESIKTLSEQDSFKANAWIEIDTGYQRSGISWNIFEQIEKSIKLINNSKSLTFLGFLNHNGSTYAFDNENDILQSTISSNEKMSQLKARFSEFNPLISIGDTPGCSLMTNFDRIDEIRPGNFVYYDLMMLQKGVCTFEDIAATVICPIIDINPERSQIVIHGGAVHFSKESIYVNEQIVYGKAIKHIGKEISDLEEFVISLSQEHGIIRIENSDISKFKIGDLIEIIPVHSCLTANLLKRKTLHF